MGPVARFVNWTNTYVIDAVVNSVALLTKGLGTFVYAILDQAGSTVRFMAYRRPQKVQAPRCGRCKPAALSSTRLHLLAGSWP